MAFVIFTLTLALNYCIYLISVADELGGLGWRRQCARARFQNAARAKRWTDARVLCPEDLVFALCQHGCLSAVGTAMTHTTAVCVHTPLQHAELSPKRTAVTLASGMNH